MKQSYGKWILRLLLAMLCTVGSYLAVVSALLYFGYARIVESDVFGYSLIGVLVFIFVPIALPRRTKE